MGTEMAFPVLRFCVILCSFLVHGSSAEHVANDAVSPALTPTFRRKVAQPKKAFVSSTPISQSPGRAPSMRDIRRPTIGSPAPSKKHFQHSARMHTNSVASPIGDSYYNHHHHHHHHQHQYQNLYSHHHAKTRFVKSGAGPSDLLPPPPHGQHAMGPSYAVSPRQSPDSSTTSQSSTRPAPSQVPIYPPAISPTSSTLTMTPPPASTLLLPPPPPNQDCAAITCMEPLTYTPPGLPCGCVQPIQVRMRLSIALYTFFPLVSELAEEISSSLSLKQSQVRIMGANAASQQLQQTIVLVNLVPLEAKFNDAAAFSAYQKFWHRKIQMNPSIFGSYEVLDVRYPGLPPSLASNLATMDRHPYSADNKDNGRNLPKPLGVDVPRKQKSGLDGSVLAAVIVSSVTGFVICIALASIAIIRFRSSAIQSEEAPPTSISSFEKPPAAQPDNTIYGYHLAGAAQSLASVSKSVSGSMSFDSAVPTFTGSAKVFSLEDIERATDGFDVSRVLGEGGFGLVYRGTFDDGEQVAVKVLKRDTRHGGREFLSEVEMLSRLHHRNLVKLLGICTEDHIRCLVYELVPNGSVDSHLHGVDKEIASLDWATRMIIALGAARGLAYLHEDSSPCVIHRDFKSSNILLEHDFTPKVSDFGLARTALNEGNQPISTHVIGTFGYLAPEYAMTGHLLVKSDVYSYGVVLLELLTGRKPVDFSKPPGQENLVAWAHPLLTSNEGLETIMDPTLKPTAPLESFSKVAAIASMCVQPEVSFRPFMGEVVQALKLVCSEFDDAKEEGPTSSFNHAEASVVDEDSKSGQILGEFNELSGIRYSVLGYESGSDAKIASSSTDLVRASEEFKEREYRSLRRHYSSGPLGSGSKRQFWQRLGRFSRGSMRERLWPGSH